MGLLVTKLLKIGLLEGEVCGTGTGPEAYQFVEKTKEWLNDICTEEFLLISDGINQCTIFEHLGISMKVSL